MKASTIVRIGAALVAIFVVVTAIASVAGAKNLGTAMTFGQVAFGVALVAVLLRGPRPGSAAPPGRPPE